MNLSTEDLQAITSYRMLARRMEEAKVLEDRAFRRFVEGSGTAKYAAATRRRVDRLSADLYAAESAVYRIMDRVGDSSGDVDRFAFEATKKVAATDL